MNFEEREPSFLDYVQNILEGLGADVTALVAVGVDSLPLALWSWPSELTSDALDGVTCTELAGAVQDVEAVSAHIVVVGTNLNDCRGVADYAAEVLGDHVRLDGQWAITQGKRTKLRDLATTSAEFDSLLLENTRLAALEKWRLAIECASTHGELDPGVLEHLWLALADALSRDAMIVDLIPGQQRIAEALCQDGHAAGLREGLACIFGPNETCPAPRRALLAAIHVAELIHELRPSAHALGVAALAWWWLDESSNALDVTQRARVVDPRHRLSALVEAAVIVGMRPGWRSEAA